MSAELVLENVKSNRDMQESLVNLEMKVREQRRELDVAIQRLKKSDDFKLQFITIFHDLRKPLTCIIGLAQNLLDQVCGPLTPSQQAYLEKVHWNANRLQRMTDDLLDYAVIEPQKFPIKVDEVNLPLLVGTVVNQFQVLAKKDGQHIEILCPQQTLILKADENALIRVLTNLLDNAMKYTPPNGTIRVKVDSRNPHSVALSVQDTGPGISPAVLPNLCKPFCQRQPGRDGSVRGLGLGLFIVKSLVELHQGTLAIDSELGAGTRFTITLPLP